MPSISADTRTVFWVIAALAGFMSAIFGSELAKNLIYWLSKRGRPPAKRSPLVWIVFLSSMVIWISLGALAALAPDQDVEKESSFSPNVSVPSSENSATATVEAPTVSIMSTSTNIPSTQTPEFSFEKFDQFDSGQLTSEYNFIGFGAQPEMVDGNLHFDYLGENAAVGIAPIDKLSLIDVNLNSKALTFVVASIAIDDATAESYVFLQVHLKLINDTVYYANFGLKDTGEIFIAETSDPYTLGDILVTVPGNARGEFNDLFVSFIGDKIQFTGNHETLYMMESLVNSVSLNLYVTAPDTGYIKTRWDYLGWSFDE